MKRMGTSPPDPLPSAGRMLGLVVSGFEVEFDPDTEQLAQAIGVGRWRRIVVGPRWFGLYRRERYAILLHEAGHLLHHHLALRLLALPLYWTGFGQRFAVRQELQADAFVAQQGYGADLLAVLIKVPVTRGPFYPDFDERTRALTRAIKERAECGVFATS